MKDNAKDNLLLSISQKYAGILLAFYVKAVFALDVSGLLRVKDGTCRIMKRTTKIGFRLGENDPEKWNQLKSQPKR